MSPPSWSSDFSNSQAYFSWHQRGLIPKSSHLKAQQYSHDLFELGAAAFHEKWNPESQDTKAKLASFLGTHPTQLAWTANTGSSLALVAFGGPLQPGDEVLIGENEYASTHLIFGQAAKMKGFSVRILKPETDGGFSPSWVLNQVNPSTKMLVLSLVVLQTGERIFLEEIAEGLKKKCPQTYLVVDAVQGIGQVPFQFSSSGVSALAGDCRKWLLGSDGAGFLALSGEFSAQISPTIPGLNGLSNPSPYAFDPHQAPDFLPHAGKLEGGALSSFAQVVGGSSLAWLLEQNPQEMAAHHQLLREFISIEFPKLGLSPLFPKNPERRSSLLPFVHHRNPNQLADTLKTHNIQAAVKGSFLVISVHLANTETQLTNLAQTLKKTT